MKDVDRHAGRRGFTLIEVLITTAVIGILAAMAIPAYVGARERSFVAQMQSDLRNLSSAQELFHMDNAAYTDDVRSLSLRKSGEVALAIPEAGIDGWSASAAHPSVPDRRCAFYYGDAGPVAPATRPGVVMCGEAMVVRGGGPRRVLDRGGRTPRR